MQGTTSAVAIRRASLADVETLVELRMALERESGHLAQDTLLAAVRRATRQYFLEALPAEAVLVWVAEAQRTSQFAEPDLLNSVIVPLMENEMGAFPRGQDVLTEIGAVDLLPDGTGGGYGFLHGEASETPEVGGRIAEGRFAQRQETLNVPLLDVALIGIDVDAKVEKVGDEAAMLFPVVTVSGLENVQAF
jgi:hypothetical protein